VKLLEDLKEVPCDETRLFLVGSDDVVEEAAVGFVFLVVILED
jgi:hypothetical protein